MQEPEPSSRHLHAGRHLGSQQAPPRLIPGLQSIPGFDVTFVFRHVISGSLPLAFLAHTCRAQLRDFSRDAHHHGSLPQQLTVVCGLRLHSGRGGPPGHNARLLHLLHSTAFRIWVFYIQPPSTFVAHLQMTISYLRTRTAKIVRHYFNAPSFNTRADHAPHRHICRSS
jgi:hypothetical protein